MAIEHPFPTADLATFRDAALAAVMKARGVSLAVPGEALATRAKFDSSPVTEADLGVERCLREELGARFPEHGLMGEEYPPVNPDSPFQWIMDPIDGTVAFSRGIPRWGTILGLWYHGHPLLGIIDHAAIDKTYHAARGLGAWVGGRRLQITDLPEDVAFKDELMGIGDRPQFARVGRLHHWDALHAAHPRVRAYTDCYGHTLAAQGSIGALADYGLRNWDLAATQVLVEEAGGEYRVVGTAPDPVNEGGTCYDVVIGKPRAVAWMAGVIAAADAK